MTYNNIIQVTIVVWPSVVPICVSILAHNYTFNRRVDPKPIQFELCPKEAIPFDYTNDVICLLEYYVI